MSKYQAYPEYKDSGVEWLGEVPEHWQIKRISYVASLRSGDAIVSEQIEVEGDYPVYGGNGLRGYTASFNHNGKYILIGRQGALCGNINYGNGEFWASEHAVVVHPHLPISINWLGETLRTMNLNQYNVSAAQPGLAVANITCLKIPFPPKNEQDKIANFLDHETAKIDTLIDKQQQLIQLLKEKRQAVISHAVTKGLNSHAPMRDSGVEWLGEVPEHWRVGRYKFCTNRIVVGIAEAATHAYAETGVPIIRSTNIREEGLELSGMLFIKKEFAEANSSKYLYANDVITVRTGYPGTSAVIPETLDKSQCFTNLVATPKEEMSPLFLSEYLNSHTGKSYFDLLGWGSAQKNISVPILQNIPIAWPETSEQAEIVSYVQEQRKRYTKLVAKGEKQIELLKERRTALISAAVTGKIDVRHHASHPACDLQSSKSTVHADL